MTEERELERVPRHVAIIMDGNGRWAKARGLPRLAGHRAGTENLRPILEASVEFGIEYLTIWAFSTENWRRPRSEVSALMRYLSEFLSTREQELISNGVRLLAIGDIARLPRSVQKELQRVKASTSS
ncbi:MAG: polyprenyl diphosphate synthase, partial [Anaerolineae bacterium]